VRAAAAAGDDKMVASSQRTVLVAAALALPLLWAALYSMLSNNSGNGMPGHDDDGMHQQHQQHEHMMMMTMPMTFEFSMRVPAIVVAPLHASGDGPFAYALLLSLFVALCIAKERLFAARAQRRCRRRQQRAATAKANYMPIVDHDSEAKQQQQQQQLQQSPQQQQPQQLFSAARLVDTAYYTLNLTLGYVVMLALMAFNAGLLLAILLGSAVGYLLYSSEDYHGSSSSGGDLAAATATATADDFELSRDCCER
jgi:hypothetical protein